MGAIIAAAATAAVLVTHPVAARDCSSAKTNIELRDCANLEFTQADKRLNEVYQQLMASKGLDEDARKLLRDAQRKWIPFRDAECAWAGDTMRGGTGAPILVLSCLARLTQDRAEALEQALTAR